jgi:hypothetical protein
MLKIMRYVIICNEYALGPQRSPFYNAHACGYGYRIFKPLTPNLEGRVCVDVFRSAIYSAQTYYDQGLTG